MPDGQYGGYAKFMYKFLYKFMYKMNDEEKQAAVEQQKKLLEEAAKKITKTDGGFIKTSEYVDPLYYNPTAYDFGYNTRLRYPGDKKGQAKKDGNMKNKCPLEEYIAALKGNPLVDDVYLTADERERTEGEPTYVSVLIKLITMSSINERVLNHQNERLTDFLMNNGVEGADFIQVSFQYSEVYIHEF